MKMGKVRAATLNKKRAVEMAAIENERSGERGGEGVMQGLYAEWQTEPFVPDPVVDVSIPHDQCLVFLCPTRLEFIIREKYRRTISETSTCTRHLCFQREEFMSHVSC